MILVLSLSRERHYHWNSGSLPVNSIQNAISSLTAHDLLGSRNKKGESWYAEGFKLFIWRSEKGALCLWSRVKKGGIKSVYIHIPKNSFILLKASFQMAPHALLNKEAPSNLTLKDQHDQDVNIADRIGKSTIVLFFYPKDSTFVCTKEVCILLLLFV